METCIKGDLAYVRYFFNTAKASPFDRTLQDVLLLDLVMFRIVLDTMDSIAKLPELIALFKELVLYHCLDPGQLNRIVHGCHYILLLDQSNCT